MTQVVLVRPWTDARAGGGCCGGEVRDGVAPRLTGEHPPGERDAAAAHDPVGRVWRLLREQVPEVDVQVVDASNVWLPTTVFGFVRRREGTMAALRAAARAGVAGSVLVDGRRVGDLEDLGAEGVLAAVAHPAR